MSVREQRARRDARRAATAGHRPTQIPIAPHPVDAASDAAELAERVSRVARGGTRAAVLGVNDGLVTNICLILAVAGANAAASSVRLAGFASLLAGSFSMAAGEWVSVRSQVELHQGLLAEIRRLIARNPRLILDDLSDHLEAAGFGRATARAAATELPLDEPRFLRFCATTLFGLDANEPGSPMTAAVTSLVLFAAGASVPLLPWFVTKGGAATALSVLLTGAASLAVGAFVAYSSDRPIVLGALRQLMIVAAASAVTFAIGRAFGAALS